MGYELGFLEWIKNKAGITGGSSEPLLMNGSNRTISSPAGVQNGNFPVNSVGVVATPAEDEAFRQRAEAALARRKKIENAKLGRGISGIRPDQLTPAETKVFLDKYKVASGGVPVKGLGGEVIAPKPQTLSPDEAYLDSLNIKTIDDYNRRLAAKHFSADNAAALALFGNGGSKLVKRKVPKAVAPAQVNAADSVIKVSDSNNKNLGNFSIYKGVGNSRPAYIPSNEELVPFSVPTGNSESTAKKTSNGVASMFKDI